MNIDYNVLVCYYTGILIYQYTDILEQKINKKQGELRSGTGDGLMSNNLVTKEAIAMGVKQLLEKWPLSKISVKDIKDHCNISRNTFYYHFKDKYELINWIFYSDMQKNVNSFTESERPMDSFVNVCRCLYENRKFYFACFQYIGQNSLYEYLYEFYFDLWENSMNLRYSTCDFVLTKEEIQLIAKLKSHSLIGIISDWIRGGMHADYLKYLEKLEAIIEQEISGYTMMCEKVKRKVC